ncbi:hypothetical protein BX616_006999 [Lobosporangium transversale]|nr:hypothetical protein BX616_006999 [Lobosporangium transversale]
MTDGFQPGYGAAIWSPALTPMGEGQYIGALIGLFLLSVGFRALVAAQGYLEAYLYLHYYLRLSSTHVPRTFKQAYGKGEQEPDLVPVANDHDENQNQSILSAKQQDSNALQIFPDHSLSALHAQDQQQKQQLKRPQGEQGQKDEGSLTQSFSQPPQLTAHAGLNRNLNLRYNGLSKKHRHPLYQPYLYDHDHYGKPSSSVSFLSPMPTVQPFVWQAEVSRALLMTAVVGVGYMLMLVIMTYNSAYFAVILVGVFVGEVYFGRWARARPISPTPSSSKPKPKPELTALYPYTARERVNGEHSVSTSSTSLASRSSHGYSMMMHHGASADGC